jgi:hypothetical protein
MKHIKVFEEFRDTGHLETPLLDKYEIKKELPTKGSCFCSIGEIKTIQQYLENYQYKAWREESDVPDGTVGIHWWIFMERMSHYEFLDAVVTNEDTIKFDDYFKLKYEFRGHNLKKFGV